MSTLVCLLVAIHSLLANRNVLGVAPRLLSHRQLLGDPDHPFLFDPSPDTASSADTPKSISECRDVQLEGSTFSAACLEASTHTMVTLAVDLDACIANVNGILTYSAAGNASQSCSQCSVSKDLVLTCVCDSPLTNLPTQATSLSLDVSDTGVYYTLNGMMGCMTGAV